MAINKEEMSAFNKVLRNAVLPKAKEMSKRAIKQYEKQNKDKIFLSSLNLIHII